MKKQLLVALCLFPLVTFAAMKDDDGVAPDKGDGCGLGWQVTQKRTLIATTTRGTTNAFVPPTFGMSSGTLDCEQHSFAKNEQPAVIFAATNQESLAIEMAAGRGEYLDAFARTMGCDGASVSEFGRHAQKNFSVIAAPARNGSELYLNAKKSIESNPALASCRPTA